jgi:hypothetical protein
MKAGVRHRRLQIWRIEMQRTTKSERRQFRILRRQTSIFPKRQAMLHPETLEMYRKMTLSEKMEVTLALIRENTPRMFQGTQEQIDRRFEILRLQNDDRNRRMLEAISRSRDKNGQGTK